MRLSTPIPVSVERHPYMPDAFTHMVREADARRRGWHFFGDAPLGLWRTRAAARRAAQKLQARGLVTLKRST